MIRQVIEIREIMLGSKDNQLMFVSDFTSQQLFWRNTGWRKEIFAPWQQLNPSQRNLKTEDLGLNGKDLVITAIERVLFLCGARSKVGSWIFVFAPPPPPSLPLSFAVNSSFLCKYFSLLLRKGDSVLRGSNRPWKSLWINAIKLRFPLKSVESLESPWKAVSCQY